MPRERKKSVSFCMTKEQEAIIRRIAYLRNKDGVSNTICLGIQLLGAAYAAHDPEIKALLEMVYEREGKITINPAGESLLAKKR